MEKKQRLFHFNNRIHNKQKTACSFFRNSNHGMTMVEVLMGFVILALLLGMFSGIIVTASNMYYNSVDGRTSHCRELSIRRVLQALFRRKELH